jgi:hypothetical protein
VLAQLPPSRNEAAPVSYSRARRRRVAERSRSPSPFDAGVWVLPRRSASHMYRSRGSRHASPRRLNRAQLHRRR